MNMKKILPNLILVIMVMFMMPIAVRAEKSDMQMAQELIYGKWAKAQTDGIKYRFDENNVRIVGISEVNPMGQSSIQVQIKNPNGVWTTFKTVLAIQLENGRYAMYIIKRRDNGSMVNDGDANIKFIKVYWND